MRVLITGGAGFIGSHLAEKRLRSGDEVTVYDNLSLGRRSLLGQWLKHPLMRFIEADLLDLERLKRAATDHDVVYHLAANSGGAGGARATDVDLQQGTIATYSVLEAMRMAGVKKLVFASTNQVYGGAPVRPPSESDGPLVPTSFHGASKIACESLCAAFSHHHGVQAWVYRLGQVIGPHSTHGLAHELADRLLPTPDVLTVPGDGLRRDAYLHVDDCIAGMEFGVGGSTDAFQVFNLAGEGMTTVRFLAERTVEAVESWTGTRASVAYGETDRGGKGDLAPNQLDGSKLRALGWRARSGSDEAVSRAVREIVAEKAIARGLRARG